MYEIKEAYKVGTLLNNQLGIGSAIYLGISRCKTLHRIYNLKTNGIESFLDNLFRVTWKKA